MSVYKPHTVKLFPDALVSAVILQSTLSQQLDMNPEVIAEITAAEISPGHVALVGQKPMFPSATYDLKSFFDAVGLSGLCVKSATNAGIVSYWQKFDDCGTATSGSVHRSYTFGNGLIIPKTLRCDHRGDARVEYELYPISSDGSTAPVTISDTAALPTITTAHARWTMGPITLGGLTFSEYSSIEIDFGNSIQTRGVASNLYETHIEQATFAPKITITGIDPAWLSSSKVAVGGLVVAQATDKIFFRKRAQTASSFVADGTAQHLKFTPAGLAHVNQANRAEAQRVSETTVVITCATDSSGNAGLAINTASAIS